MQSLHPACNANTKALEKLSAAPAVTPEARSNYLPYYATNDSGLVKLKRSGKNYSFSGNSWLVTKPAGSSSKRQDLLDPTAVKETPE